MCIGREKAETVDWMMVIMVTSCTGRANVQKMRLENCQVVTTLVTSRNGPKVKPKRLFFVIVDEQEVEAWKCELNFFLLSSSLIKINKRTALKSPHVVCCVFFYISVSFKFE